MQIEVLSVSDAQAYKALLLEGFRQFPNAFTSTVEERENEADSFWVERLSSESRVSVVLGAKNNDQLVGTVALQFSTGAKTQHKGQLLAMYVRPEYRKIGIARALVDEALRVAHERQETVMLTLTVTQGNEAAEALYRSAGFEEFGVEPMAVLGTDGFLSKVHMWRSVVD